VSSAAWNDTVPVICARRPARVGGAWSSEAAAVPAVGGGGGTDCAEAAPVQIGASTKLPAATAAQRRKRRECGRIEISSRNPHGPHNGRLDKLWTGKMAKQSRD
jgi:hypothetical protein